MPSLQRHFAQRNDAVAKAAAVANYFNRSEQHKSHGRRIGRDEYKQTTTALKKNFARRSLRT